MLRSQVENRPILMYNIQYILQGTECTGLVLEIFICFSLFIYEHCTCVHLLYNI